jgi:hypothetical protein
VPNIRRRDSSCRRCLCRQKTDWWPCSWDARGGEHLNLNCLCVSHFCRDNTDGLKDGLQARLMDALRVALGIRKNETSK